MCFTTHCLSCIAFEAGGRSSHGNPVSKSAAFNALFRRLYNLRIIVLVTNIIAGLITTLMMTIGDKYDIPYLYLPWLVNTMKGMALCEGPALINLASALLPNVTLPTAVFTLVTFVLYAEELCIWNNVLVRFQRCWREYHDRKLSSMEKVKEEMFITSKKLFFHGDTNEKFHMGVEKLKSVQKPDEFSRNNDNRINADISFRPVKSTIGDNGDSIRNQLPNSTG
ncbi:uncharacterized protein LOC108629729 isoform X2 [Ceratina calcarata]|nr:uncharacterized protein LOC108629729 isoform X2 [Ceratina calcarata]